MCQDTRDANVERLRAHLLRLEGDQAELLLRELDLRFAEKRGPRVVAFDDLEFTAEDWTRQDKGGGCFTYTVTANQGAVEIEGANGETLLLLFDGGQAIDICGNVAHLPPKSE